MRPVFHIVLHVLAPAVLARVAFPARWRRAWLVMTAALAIDVDHLLADPIYDPGRCSLGFHPLHTAAAGVAYALLALWPRTRVLGVGLLLHLALDGFDCLWMAAERQSGGS